MNAGPRKGQRREKPRACPSSERRAARATAASPGSTASTSGCPFGRGRRRLGSGLRTSVFSSSLNAPLPERLTRIAAASRLPSACSRPATSTNSGPSNGSRRAQDELAPGPDPALVEVAQHLGVAVGDALEDGGVAGLELGQRHRVVGRPCRARRSGSGRRAGRGSGRRASRRSAARAPRRCSARAPRPRRGPGPRACRAPRRGRTRSAGGGGSPRAPPARPAAVSATPW